MRKVLPECVIVSTEVGCPWVEPTASWRSARSPASALLVGCSTTAQVSAQSRIAAGLGVRHPTGRERSAAWRTSEGSGPWPCRHRSRS
jgi:hypothetical protein